MKCSVEHHCPSCGAPVFLDEADRFFVCTYCRVRSCIAQKGFARYFLTPHPEVPGDTELAYLPYWRFKGVQYACSMSGVDHWFTDTSCLALKDPPTLLPYSLGFRSQALTLKRVSVRTPGSFLRPSPLADSLKSLTGRNKLAHDALIREDIGETVSLIYSPVFHRGGQLFDGVLNAPLGPGQGILIDNEDNLCRPEKETRILSGICPGCGWDLDGQSDSLVLVCKNCDSLWQPKQDALARVRFKAARPQSDEDVLIPFWKISAQVHHMELNTAQDIMSLANLPGAANQSLKEKPLSFWAPAFKIRPKIFLRVSRQLTLAQPDPDLDKTICKNTHYPITLPAAEAIQSIRLTLASLARPLKDHIAALAGTQIKATRVSLIFLPFEVHPHEFIHREMGLAINKNVLKLAGNL